MGAEANTCLMWVGEGEWIEWFEIKKENIGI